MFSLASLVFAQQTDTLLLHPEQLAERDIYDPLVSEKRKIKIVSGSRFPIEASDLPFSTHVITKEEIRRNGFETLVDALKYAPGIQVSQPGSALDGETFLMRGLLGNTYAKILVNDVPIKPTFSPSMPIGAQLPVKEAERIEIIYGAAAALYGADASAGVINIITRESEKPVFMQADLSIGSGVFSNMNVMFGGRLGRDKNLLKYFAYGSNTQMGNRNNTFNDVNLFRVTTYAPSYSDGQFLLKLPNHVGNEFRSLITNTPHQSRKIGFNIKYKRFIFSAEKLYRRDHSAIGFNPVAYSYSNPQTSTGESILRINLAIHKEREKRNKRTDFTYLRHQVDNRSSMLPVRNRLALMLWQAANAEASNAGNSNVDSFFMRDYNKYMNGLRYMYGRSDEIRLEHLRNYRIMKDITLTFGLNLKAAWGYPNMSYLGRPAIEFREQAFESSGSLFFDSLTFSIFPEWSIVLESNTFAQLFYNGNRLKLTVGINNASIGYSITEGGGPSEFFSTRSPRLAGLFKLTQNINLYGSWGTAYRFSSPYHQRNSFFIFSDNYPKIQTGFVPHTPEKSAAWEGGLRFRNKNDRFGADLTLFSNKSTNLIRLGLLEEWAPDSSFYYGQLAYKNVEAASIRYTGGSLSVSTSFTLRQKRFSEGSISFSWINPRLDANEADIETFRLKQKKGSVIAFQNSFFLFRKSTFVLGLMRYKGVSTAYFPKEKDGFWTVDFTYRYAFTDRFDAYLKVTNLLGVEYAGILPEADKADLLLYNPQQTQFIKLGMNYYIE
ncbi:MAG: TonB-dependent receptor [Saprospiraceae bacterium]|nr:TonB-dependent receptor [Saprospiraceae bacterium]